MLTGNKVHSQQRQWFQQKISSAQFEFENLRHCGAFVLLPNEERNALILDAYIRYLLKEINFMSAGKSLFRLHENEERLRF